jgi:hypothetical protein
MYTIEATVDKELTEIYIVVDQEEALRLAEELKARKYLVEVKEDFQSE